MMLATASLLPRSAHGFRITNWAALLEDDARVMKLKPVIDNTLSTPGAASKIFRVFSITASVRCSEAPLGNWVITKK
jgi:hypothetical protein